MKGITLLALIFTCIAVGHLVRRSSKPISYVFYVLAIGIFIYHFICLIIKSRGV